MSDVDDNDNRCDRCLAVVLYERGRGFVGGHLYDSAVFICRACIDARATLDGLIDLVRVIDTLAAIDVREQRAVAEERERCARVCAGVADRHHKAAKAQPDIAKAARLWERGDAADECERKIRGGPND